jgi:hypothetical protein
MLTHFKNWYCELFFSKKQKKKALLLLDKDFIFCWSPMLQIKFHHIIISKHLSLVMWYVSEVFIPGNCCVKTLFRLSTQTRVNKFYRFGYVAHEIFEIAHGLVKTTII